LKPLVTIIYEKSFRNRYLETPCFSEEVPGSVPIYFLCLVVVGTVLLESSVLGTCIVSYAH
jgi:hypothetical protein